MPNRLESVVSQTWCVPTQMRSGDELHVVVGDEGDLHLDARRDDAQSRVRLLGEELLLVLLVWDDELRIAVPVAYSMAAQAAPRTPP